jgi:2-iminobutanoate/2-iminopropanoate deaminase
MARRSIDIESFQHANPIPAACRIGPLLISGITPPFDPGTRNVPDTLEAQVENLFTHVGQMLDAGGGSWDDVARMTFYVVDPSKSREAVNGPWEQRFPDPASRPARYNQPIPDLGGPVQVSCDFIAYVEG